MCFKKAPTEPPMLTQLTLALSQAMIRISGSLKRARTQHFKDFMFGTFQCCFYAVPMNVSAEIITVTLM